jgi:AraC family transcriptional regulator
MDVEAELELSIAHVRLVQLDHPGLSENLFARPDVYWVDGCLTPRRPNARARYVSEWGPHRFGGMGSIIALPPRRLLHLQNRGGRHESLICALNAEAVDRWAAPDFVWTDRRLEACLDIASGSIRGLLLRLAHELRNPGLASRQMCEALVYQLSIELARYLGGVGEPVEKGGLADWRLRAIDRRISEPGPPPSLEELAGLCHVSVRQLTRGFRASRGCSVGDYLAQTRMDMAKRRLASEASIKTVAMEMGFGSPSSFTSVFRRSTGMTPGEFRQRAAQVHHSR